MGQVIFRMVLFACFYAMIISFIHPFELSQKIAISTLIAIFTEMLFSILITLEKIYKLFLEVSEDIEEESENDDNEENNS